MDNHRNSLYKLSKKKEMEDKVSCKIKGIDEFKENVRKIGTLVSLLPSLFAQTCTVTAQKYFNNYTTSKKSSNSTYNVSPLTNNVFDGCDLFSEKMCQRDNVLKDSTFEDKSKNVETLQCHAVTTDDNTLEDLIEFAKTSFDENLIHPIQTFLNTKAHRITKISLLHDDAVNYWLKICVCVYRTGSRIAYVDTSAFLESVTFGINNENDQNNCLVMPKVMNGHWTLFTFDHDRQSLNYYNSLHALNPRAPTEKDVRRAKQIIQKTEYDSTNLICQTPALPEAFQQQNNYDCGVIKAALIEAKVQGRSFEEFARTFNAGRYRKRMQDIYTHIRKHGKFPFRLFFDSENVPMNRGAKNVAENVKVNIDKSKPSKSPAAQRKEKQREKMTEAQKEQERIKNQEQVAAHRKSLDDSKKAKANEKEKERAAKRKKAMSAEEKAKINAKEKERAAKRKKAMSAEEKAKANAKDRKRVAESRNHLTPTERAKAKEKAKKRMARRWKSMSPKQRIDKRKRDRSRKKRLRRKRKEENVTVTAEDKAKHAVAQQRYIDRNRQHYFEKLQCRARLKKILKLMNEIRNGNFQNLHNDLANYNLLSKNEYARIRQLFSRQKRYGYVHSSVLHRYRKIKQVNRHLKAMDEINGFVENISDNKKQKENLRKYGEIGILLAIRNENEPEDEKEARIQLLQAQYLFKKIKSMENFATESLEKTLKLLRNQLDIKQIKWLQNESRPEHLVRVIGRIPYHLKGKKEDDEGFSSLEDLYPSLFKMFMGIEEETPIDQNMVDNKISDDVVEMDFSNNGFKFKNYQNVIFDSEGNIVEEESAFVEIVVDEDDVVEEEEDETLIALNDPNDDEVMKYERKMSQMLTTVEKISPKMNEILNKAIEEDILVEEELKKNAGPLGHFPLRIMTKIKRCCENCPMLTPEKAEILHKALSDMCIQKDDDLMDSISDIMGEHNNVLGSTVFEALKLFEACKTGVRSIIRRFVEIRTFVYFLARIKLAIETCNYEELQSIAHYSNVPRCVMLANSAEFYDYEEKLTEEAAFQKFGINIEQFHKAISENETETCAICNQLNLPSNIVKLDYKKAEKYMSDGAKNYYKGLSDKLKGCKTCADKIKNNKMPPAAVINGFDMDPIYDVEQELNWIEKALCQRVRPVQSIINLRDVSGRYTNIKGKKGAMVLLPVPTENTITHMSNILPCSKGLTIVVNTTAGKAIVRLPLVIKYLTMLKEKNPLYKDIEINENFTFDKDESLIFNKPPTADQIQALIANNNDEPHLLTQEVAIQPIANVEDESPDGTAFQQYNLQKCPYLPQDINMTDIDAMSFPELHTEGNFGFDHIRNPKVTRRQYIRYRLKNENRRFAKNVKWLTFCQGLLEIKDIKDSISTQARIGRDKLKGENLLKMLESEDETLQQCMSSQFAALRGHKAYWQQVKLELKAHIAIFGAPNWFLTLNPSEKDWTELHAAYSATTKVEVTSQNIRDLIAEDPVIWCRHFQRRVREFFKKCLLTDKCPLGKVTNYFYRIEYQHRGTEHVHCLLWVEGAPNPGDDEETITKYIDEHVTASEPDPVKSPLLYELVNKHQKHWKKHSTTCKRLFKHRGQMFFKCRFEFPRPATSKTIINRFASPLLTLGGGKSKFYSLKRKKGEEQWINDYSPELLLAWKANMDLQFLSSDLMDIVNYVTGYTTKGESAKTESLLDSLRGDHISKKDKFRIYASMLKHREMGVMEIVDMLMGHQMYRFDSGHVFINSNKDEKRSRILKARSKIKNAENAYETNWYDVYYPKRSQRFENFSLFNMLVNFKIRNNKDSKVIADDEDNDDVVSTITNNPFEKAFHIKEVSSPFFGHDNIKSGTLFCIDDVLDKLMVKHRANVPRLYWPKLEANNEEAREDYFRRLIFLFVPWRNEAKLQGEFETFEERWNDFMKNLELNFVDAFDDITKVIRNQTMQLEMEREIFEKRKEMKDALRVSKIDEEFEDNCLEVFERIVDKVKHESAKATINDGQREIFNEVLKIIKNCETDKTAEPLLMFCSGTAGTGKSFLINLLANELALLYATADDSNSTTKPATLIAAPTGLAAIQINGSTIHSLLSIDVQHGTEGKMKPLSKETLNLKRILFQNVKLIIIDEISMVSNVMLAKIHLRLCEFMDKNKFFGGANLLFFGDLLQLPPVKSKPIFMELLPYQLKKVFDSSAPDFSFWDLFKYQELTENMRQKKSLEFANVLGRMRVEALTQEDNDLLRSRIIKTPNGGLPNLEQLVEKYIEVKEKDPAVMALFSCSDEVTAFNNEATKQLKLNAVCIEAEDSEISTKSKKSKTAKTTRIWQQRQYNLSGKVGTGRRKKSRFTTEEKQIVDKDDQREAAGLVKKLYLAENCRIMLRRNLNARIGLVNGATGILKEIVYENGVPNELKIKFDNIEEEQCISKTSAIYNVGAEEQCCRRQFPVVVAFACTIHKSQGLTLKNVFISMESIFTGGQAFVAFSRVETIDGLYLSDYYSTKIFVKKDCLIEYNRLRQTINLPTFGVPFAIRKRGPLPTDSREAKKTKIEEIKEINTNEEILIDDNDDMLIDVENHQDIVFRDLHGEVLRRFQNTGDDCFLIAAVNFLHRMHPVINHIIAGNFNDNIPLLHQLRHLFVSSTNTVTLVRQALPSNYHTGYQDAWFTLNEIFEKMSEASLESITVYYVKTITCGLCRSRQPRLLSTTSITINVREIFPRVNGRMSFSDFFSSWSNTVSRCPGCDTDRVTSMRLDVNSSTQLNFICININNDARNERRSLTVTGLAEVIMFEIQWRLIAAVEYFPRGHYVTWVNVNSQWKIINDSTIEDASNLKTNSLCYKMLLYQRLDDC